MQAPAVHAKLCWTTVFVSPGPDYEGAKPLSPVHISKHNLMVLIECDYVDVDLF